MRPIPAVAAVLATSASLLAAGGERAPPGVTLSLVAAPDRPARFVLSMTALQSSQTPAGKIEIAADLTTEMSLEVRDRAADGSWHGVARFGRVHGRVAMPVIGTYAVDSTAPLPAEANGKSVVLSNCALGGNEFEVVLEPAGRVRAVLGVEKAVRATTERHGGDAVLQRVVSSAITERKVRETIDHALVATPLPEGPVAAGASWADADPVPGLSSAVELTASYRQQVAEVSEDSVRISGSGTLDFRPSTGPGANERMAALVSRAERKVATVSAECRVSRKDGLPLAASSETHLELGLRAASGETSLGTMKQDVRYRLDRVEAWPSQAPSPEKAPAAPPK